MHYKVKWNNKAIEDVENIIDWIKKDSEFQANRVGIAIIDLANDIPRHPLIGHIVPEIKDDNLRFRIIYGRRMIYEIRGDLVIIKRIISCKMDFLREYSKDNWEDVV